MYHKLPHPAMTSLDVKRVVVAVGFHGVSTIVVVVTVIRSFVAGKVFARSSLVTVAPGG